MQIKRGVACVVTGLVLCATLTGPYAMAQSQTEFFEACPTPYWLDKVRKPDVSIQSRRDLMQYWGNDSRSDIQFAVVAYNSMKNHYNRAEIVVPALKTMFHTRMDYPHYDSCHEYVLEKHFNYRRSLNRYGGKRADDIGGLVDNLAEIYLERNKPVQAIQWIEKLINRRADETNDHLLELIHLKYARALEQTEQYGKAIRSLDKAIKQYEGDWETQLTQERDRIRKEHPYAEGWGWAAAVLWLGMGAVGVTGVAGAVLYFWRSSEDAVA